MAKKYSVKNIFIGVIAGLIISLIGSFIFGLYMYFPPFHVLFFMTAIPSMLIFGVASFFIKHLSGKFAYWLLSFCACFCISVLMFAIWTYVDEFMRGYTPHLNWEGIIKWDLLYSLVLAVFFSPVGYFALKKISDFKN